MLLGLISVPSQALIKLWHLLIIMNSLEDKMLDIQEHYNNRDLIGATNNYREANIKEVDTMIIKSVVKITNIISSAWLMSLGTDAVKLVNAELAPEMNALPKKLQNEIGCDNNP